MCFRLACTCVPYLSLLAGCFPSRRHSFRHSFTEMFRSLASVFVILNAMALVFPILALASNRFAPAAPNATTSALHGHHWLNKRQSSSPVTTCGYLDGDPESPRTADGGYGCRVDTANGLWGFCPTTVISAKDCGLAGFCVDDSSCTAGCGRLFDRTDITTFTW